MQIKKDNRGFNTKKLPSKGEILDALIYNREDGTLINKKSEKERLHGRGYITVSVNGSQFAAHRIVFFLETGREPSHIDHIDGNKKNNKIDNLREITNRNNIRRSSIRSDGSSKYKGVFYNKREGKWVSRITVDFKAKHLTSSFDEKKCARAYDMAASYYFGEYTNLNKFYFPEIIPLETSLIIFSSTKGHFGFKDYYRYTISNLGNNFDLTIFDERILHIKRGLSGDEEQFQEMVTFAKSYGFKILTSFGDWKHNDPNQSHAKEYYKDMIKTFNNDLLNDSKYFLIFEDDYVLRKNTEISWQEILLEAKLLLDKHEDLICVRFNKKEDDKSGTEFISDNIYLQPIDYTPWGSTYTFQPTLVKSCKIKSAWDLIKTNFEILEKEHCELVSGNALKNFSKWQSPFAFFDVKYAHSIHIGEPDEKSVIENNNLDIKKCEINWTKILVQEPEWINKEYL